MIEKKDIQEQLDTQYLLDMRKLMLMEEGRRVFSYLLQKCGFKDADIKGNSRDFHAAGRRSIAIDLIFSCDALGMEGVDLRLQAEREYILLQMGIAEKIKLQREKQMELNKGGGGVRKHSS